MGKADSTLVAASFKEGLANVPADLKDVYDKNEEAFETFSEGLTNFYEELTREEREANQKTKDTTESLNASGKALNNTAILGEVQNAANYWSDQVKGTKDPLERSTAEMKMEDLTTKLNSAQQNLATLLGTPGLEMDDDTRNFYNDILSDLENDTNKTKVKFDPEKNDFVFSDSNANVPFARKQMTMKELFNNIGAKQPEATTGINNFINGMTAGKDVYKNKNDFNGRIATFISGGMETKKDIIVRYNDKEINGMDGYSVKNLLSGAVPNNFENPLSKDLYGILGTLDVNKDGSIGDEKDRSFATPANFAILKRNIEENPDLLKQVISKTISAFSGGNSYNTMLRLNTPKSGGSEETDSENTYNLPKKIRIGKTIDGRYQNSMDDYAAEDLLNDVKAGDSFEFEEMNYSYVFGQDGGAWHRWGLKDAEQTPTENSIVGSAADLETYVFKTRHPAFKNMVTEKEEGQTVDRAGKVTSLDQSKFNKIKLYDEDPVISPIQSGDNVNDIYEIVDSQLKNISVNDLKAAGFDATQTKVDAKVVGFGGNTIRVTVGGKQKDFNFNPGGRGTKSFINSSAGKQMLQQIEQFINNTMTPKKEKTSETPNADKLIEQFGFDLNLNINK